MQTFCTIITADYLAMAKALHLSLQRNSPGTELQVLVVGEKPADDIGNLIIHTVDSMRGLPFLAGIESKYAHTNASNFRWALKPVFLAYLLQKGYRSVIYTDADIYFVGRFDFLLEDLNRNRILLTPHWRNADPAKDEQSFLALLKDGLYNAGFIGVNKEAIDMIQWWAGACHYKMGELTDIGIYSDQKYLDLVPVLFEKVHIVKHQGCNLASWNIETCKRELIDGKLIINREFEPVFIHFAKDTIINILNRNDVLLKPYLDEYVAVLEKENFDLLKTIEDGDLDKYRSSRYALKHKVRFRTRLKRFFFKLAEKL